MTRHDSDALWSLARGTLGREESERVRAHVNGCAECAALLAQIQNAQPALAAFAPPPLSEAVWRELDRNVLRAAESPLSAYAMRTRLGWWRFVIAGAGMLAVVLLLVLGRNALKQLPPPKVANTQPAVAPQPAKQIATTAGEQNELMLRKARVLVLPNSRVTTAEHGPLTLVQGTVVIAADATQPGELTVRAGDIEVIVTGTQFLVRHDADVVDVAVAEGQVRVRRATQERTVVAASALTVEREQWTVRPPTPVEQAALQRVKPRTTPEAPASAAPAPAPAPTPKPRTSDRPAPAPRAREAAVKEPVPAPAPSEPAPVTPQPAPEQTPPAPAPSAHDAGTSAAAGKAGWSETITKLLPGKLKPSPAQKLDDDEYLLRKMERLASTGDCARAYTQADAWLKAHPVAADDSSELKQLRSSVQNVYTRCRR